VSPGARYVNQSLEGRKRIRNESAAVAYSPLLLFVIAGMRRKNGAGFVVEIHFGARPQYSSRLSDLPKVNDQLILEKLE
jgi:hypothetical protein